MSIETVLNAYQQLSEQEQALFQQMIQRVPTSEEELSPEWKAELDRRWKAYKNGEMKAVDGKEVQERLNAKLS